MLPGTLFFDVEFKFTDGEEGRKILVSLGTSAGLTVVAKTTSRGHRFGISYGCQATNRFPCFHLIQGCCCLRKPTWVGFDEFFEFKDTQILQRRFDGKINAIGVLPDEITEQRLLCAIDCEDISNEQETIVRAVLAAISNSRS